MRNYSRRRLLLSGLTSLPILLLSGKSWGEANPKIFNAASLAEAIKALASKEQPLPSNRLLLELPEISAEPHRISVRMRSELPGTDMMLLIVEKAMQPVAAQFTIPTGTEADIRTFIKVPGTTSVHLIVQAGGKLYTAHKQIKIAQPFNSKQLAG